MVSRRQARIARKKCNIQKRKASVEKAEVERAELRANLAERARDARYLHYSSNLASIRQSLGIDLAAEIKNLGCKNVLDIGCGNATALAELETKCPETNLFGINYRQEPEFAKLKKTKVKVGKIEEITKHIRPGSIDFAYWNYGASSDFTKDLKQIKSVLRRGGRLIFNVNPKKVDRHNVQEFGRNLERSGFKVLRVLGVTYEGMIANPHDPLEPPQKEKWRNFAFYLKKI